MSVRLAAVALLAVVTGGSLPADAATTTRQFYYQGAISDGRVVDNSGSGRPGQIVTSGASLESRTDLLSWDRFLHFPGGHCYDESGCPQAVVEPTGLAALNPADSGTAPFFFSAAVRLTEQPSGTAGMNVLQRGLYTQPQWKLQVDGGHPSCRWSDGTDAVELPADVQKEYTLDLQRWYGVRCERLANDKFQIIVTNGRTGEWLFFAEMTKHAVDAIQPSEHVMIGAKAVTGASDVLTDQFHGDLDELLFHTD